MRTAPREGGAEVGYVDKDWPIERNRFRHPPQLDPWRPIGEITAELVANMRFRRQVLRLHRLGPRITAELLAEIGAERSKPPNLTAARTVWWSLARQGVRLPGQTGVILLAGGRYG